MRSHKMLDVVAMTLEWLGVELRGGEGKEGEGESSGEGRGWMEMRTGEAEGREWGRKIKRMVGYRQT